MPLLKNISSKSLIQHCDFNKSQQKSKENYLKVEDNLRLERDEEFLIIYKTEVFSFDFQLSDNSNIILNKSIIYSHMPLEQSKENEQYNNINTNNVSASLLYNNFNNTKPNHTNLAGFNEGIVTNAQNTQNKEAYACLRTNFNEKSRMNNKYQGNNNNFISLNYS